MKTKRIGFLKGILSAVFMLALIVTMVAVMPMTVSATNVSEVVYASNLVDGDDIYDLIKALLFHEWSCPFKSFLFSACDKIPIP